MVEKVKELGLDFLILESKDIGAEWNGWWGGGDVAMDVAMNVLHKIRRSIFILYLISNISGIERVYTSVSAVSKILIRRQKSKDRFKITWNLWKKEKVLKSSLEDACVDVYYSMWLRILFTLVTCVQYHVFFPCKEVYIIYLYHKDNVYQSTR